MEGTIDVPPPESGGKMTALTALWLPILVSAVAVFVVSSIIHMTPLWHKTDYPRYSSEDRVLDALRPIAIPPGDYLMPRPANPAEMRSPEFREKLQRGPAVLLTVMPPWSGSMVILVMLSCGCCSAALLTRILILPSSRLVRCTASLQDFSRPTSRARRCPRAVRPSSRCVASPARRHSWATRSRCGRCRSGTGGPGR